MSQRLEYIKQGKYPLILVLGEVRGGKTSMIYSILQNIPNRTEEFMVSRLIDDNDSVIVLVDESPIGYQNDLTIFNQRKNLGVQISQLQYLTFAELSYWGNFACLNKTKFLVIEANIGKKEVVCFLESFYEKFREAGLTLIVSIRENKSKSGSQMFLNCSLELMQDSSLIINCSNKEAIVIKDRFLGAKDILKFNETKKVYNI